MDATSIEGGFDNAVFEAQGIFRAIMDAMARPGTIEAVASAVEPPQPMSRIAGAIALTLCDHDTPVWLDPVLARSEAVAAWLGFHTGAPIVGSLETAQFAFAADPASLLPFADFAQGAQDYPDSSATIVLQVETLDEGNGLLLAGPGIETVARLAPSPLPGGFLAQWQQNRASFPLGVDLVLAGRGAIACLPRTTRISASEG